jgi:hypothetical protein
MFRKQNHEALVIQTQIDDLTKQMSALTGDDPAYAKMVKQLIKLQTLQSETRPKPIVSGDTAVLAVTNLLGIAMIVGHERANIIASKALTFVKKAL